MVVVSCYLLWATCLKPTEELVHFLNKNSIGLLGCHQRHVVRDRRGARDFGWHVSTTYDSSIVSKFKIPTRTSSPPRFVVVVSNLLLALRSSDDHRRRLCYAVIYKIRWSCVFSTSLKIVFPPPRNNATPHTTHNIIKYHLQE